MAGAQQQQGGGSDNSLDFLWMIVLIVGGLTLFWYLGQRHIVHIVLTIRLYEIYLIEYCLKGYAFLATFLHLPLPMPNTDGLVNALTVINSNPSTLPLKQLVSLSGNVGHFLMIPVAMIAIVLAIITYFSNVTEQFRHVYNMETLRKAEFKLWPQVTPVMKVNLVKQDLDEGAWASSLTPMLFAKKYDLLIEERDPYKVTVTLNEGAAYRVFSLQVGQFWRDIETFPLHIQAL